MIFQEYWKRGYGERITGKGDGNGKTGY